MKNSQCIVVVNVSTYQIYDFLQENETKEELLERANLSKQKEIDDWKKICEKYPENKRAVINLEQAQRVKYEVMTEEEYYIGQKKFLCGDDVKEITEEEWNDALNILPPLKWRIIAGVEMFCMREMYTGSFTNQFAKYNGKYYFKMVDVKVKIFFYPIILGDKVLDLQKLNTTIDLFCVRETHTPVILHNAKLELIKLDKKTYVYQLCSKTEGLKVNRRNHFRMFLGVYGEAQIGTHTYPIVPVIIKDISASGIAFVSNENRDIAKYNKVHIMFKDMDLK